MHPENSPKFTKNIPFCPRQLKFTQLQVRIGRKLNDCRAIPKSGVQHVISRIPSRPNIAWQEMFIKVKVGHNLLPLRKNDGGRVYDGEGELADLQQDGQSQ